MIPTVYRTDVFGGIGNSIMHGFVHPEDDWLASFQRGTTAQYVAENPAPKRLTTTMDSVPRPPPTTISPSTRQATGVAAQQYPSYYVDAVPGRRVGDISGSMATVLAPFIAGKTTVYLVELGTNDVNVTPAATFIPQVNAIRDAIRAAPGFRLLIWCSPFCAGENWPDGANAFDLTVDGLKDKETQIGNSMAAFSDCYHVSWRQLRLSALNATSNPTHASSGIYTYDQTHPTFASTGGGLLAGEQLLTNYTRSQVYFA